MTVPPITQKDMRLLRNAELVIDYYQHVGLMHQFGEEYKTGRRIRNAVAYEPKDFIQRSPINELMKANTDFGDQQLLMFKESDIKIQLDKLKK